LDLNEDSLVPSLACREFIANGPPDPSDASEEAKLKRAKFGDGAVPNYLKLFEQQFGKSRPAMGILYTNTSQVPYLSNESP
jgi:hypothetical protein